MICLECESEMFLDDKDFNFKGNYDNYWCCTVCQTSCIEQVRYGRPMKQYWHTESNGVKDWVVPVKNIGGK